MTDPLLAQVLFALDIAVIERLPDSRFQILGRSPDWLELAFDRAPAGLRHTLAGALPFLEHFLVQADRAWHDRGDTRADSGPFAVGSGKDEILLRATAITRDARALLILERLTGDADTRPILQKAREQILALEQLTRQAAGVQAPTAAVARAVQDLQAADLPASVRVAVDRVAVAITQLQAVADALPKPPPKGRR